MAAGAVALVLWQGVFFRHRYPDITLRSSDYILKASGGVLGWQDEFLYFLYYLNLYPVATSELPTDYSREGALRVIATQGPTLVMDRFWTVRYGDLLKSYLFLPQAWLTHSAEDPRVMSTATGAAWAVALVALYAALWAAGRPLLAVILVVLLGSNPFQVTEAYGRNNVFSFVITTGVLVLALHVPVLEDRRPSPVYVALAPIVTGLLLATVRQIRPEPVMIGLSAVLACATATPLRPAVRVVMIALLAVSFWIGTRAWQGYFDAKFREAYRIVKAAGGHPYDGPRQIHHFFWHALWCGLGDFDTRYGYKWNDTVAMDYALPIMRARGFVATGYPALAPQKFDSLTLGVYWDRGRKYARTPFETPEYIEVVREKVVHDITHDPWWYATILARRVWRVLTTATPPSLALGDGRHVGLPAWPVWGFLPLVAAAALAWARRWFEVKLILFVLPTAATALLVYSGEGTAYYSIAHLVALACLLALGVQALAVRLWPREASC